MVGEGKKAPLDGGADLETGDDSALFGAMITGAIAACNRRAAAIRASLRCRFTGQRLRAEMEAARRQAEAELTGTLALVKREIEVLRRGEKERRGRQSQERRLAAGLIPG